MQVDSVQRWMEDLKLMTECECMCVLQAKPISLEEDARGDVILAGSAGPGDPLQLLLKRGWVISTELRRIGQKLAQDRWARVHSMSVRLTCHARSMVSEYSAVSRSSSQEMGQVNCPEMGVWGLGKGIPSRRVGLNCVDFDFFQLQGLPPLPIKQGRQLGPLLSICYVLGIVLGIFTHISFNLHKL